MLITYASGFSISFILFIAVNYLFPPSNIGMVDDMDVFGAFTENECRRMGLAPHPVTSTISASVEDSVEKLPIDSVEKKA